MSFTAADGTTPAPILGTNFGMDFNPTVDRIRVVNDAGQNFRINPNTGAPVDGNGGIALTQMDGAISGATSTVDATAYTNNQTNATVTTQYTLSAATNQLFIQNPPNNGTQTVPLTVTLNGAVADFSGTNGFDIPPGVNVAASNSVAAGLGFAILRMTGQDFFTRVDLTTGALTGTVATGSIDIIGLAVQKPSSAPMVALSSDGLQLLRFQSATAATTSIVAVTGIAAGEVLAGIDYRPQTGQLFGLGVNSTADNATLYVLDPQGGAATAVGAAGQIAFVDAVGTTLDLPAASSGYGIDFNPTVDRVRVVTATGLNFRVNPVNGSPVDGNTGAAGIQADGILNGLQPGSTGVSGTAYTNSFGQPLIGGVTTQYTIDSTANGLYIQNPPNNGTQTNFLPITLNSAPLDFSAVNGFDIPGDVRVSASGSPVTSGLAYAALEIGGSTSLYSINLVSGAATLVGPIGTGVAVNGLAVGETIVK